MHKSKKTIILHNILSSNSVYKLKTFIEQEKLKLGEVEVWFCGPTESNRRWKLKEEIPFSYQILPSSKIELRGKDLFTYFISFSIFRELKKAQPDHLIINGWDQFAYQVAFLWGSFHHTYITLWNGSTVYEKSWRRTLTLPLVRWFVSLSDDYLAYGQRAKEYLQFLGAESSKISIFPNDVNQAYFRQQAKVWRKQRQKMKKRFGIKTKYAFLFVGQFIQRKGVFDLLQAFDHVQRRHPEWSLLFVGYGLLEKQMREYVQMQQIPQVHFLGEYEQYDLPQIYAISECLVLPSHEEVWGLVVNEALAAGLKVVVSDVCGCVPDLIKSSQIGQKFHAQDISDLERALERVVKTYV